jgi:hypothetical protein
VHHEANAATGPSHRLAPHAIIPRFLLRQSMLRDPGNILLSKFLPCVMGTVTIICGMRLEREPFGRSRSIVERRNGGSAVDVISSSMRNEFGAKAGSAQEAFFLTSTDQRQTPQLGDFVG